MPAQGCRLHGRGPRNGAQTAGTQRGSPTAPPEREAYVGKRVGDSAGGRGRGTTKRFGGDGRPEPGGAGKGGGDGGVEGGVRGISARSTVEGGFPVPVLRRQGCEWHCRGAWSCAAGGEAAAQALGGAVGGVPWESKMGEGR